MFPLEMFEPVTVQANGTHQDEYRRTGPGSRAGEVEARLEDIWWVVQLISSAQQSLFLDPKTLEKRQSGLRERCPGREELSKLLGGAIKKFRMWRPCHTAQKLPNCLAFLAFKRFRATAEPYEE